MTTPMASIAAVDLAILGIQFILGADNTEQVFAPLDIPYAECSTTINGVRERTFTIPENKIQTAYATAIAQPLL